MRDQPIEAYPRADGRGDYLVLGSGRTRDELQASGRWLASDQPVDLETHR